MSNKQTKKTKVEVFESSGSTIILKTFNSIAELENWLDTEESSILDINADQVAINDMVLLGWDELYNFV